MATILNYYNDTFRQAIEDPEADFKTQFDAIHPFHQYLKTVDDVKVWKEFIVWEGRKVGFYLKNICYQKPLNKKEKEFIDPRTMGVTRPCE